MKFGSLLNGLLERVGLSGSQLLTDASFEKCSALFFGEKVESPRVVIILSFQYSHTQKKWYAEIVENTPEVQSWDRVGTCPRKDSDLYGFVTLDCFEGQNKRISNMLTNIIDWYLQEGEKKLLSQRHNIRYHPQFTYSVA